jgi:hypothetical protein
MLNVKELRYIEDSTPHIGHRYVGEDKSGAQGCSIMAIDSIG